MNVNSLVPMAGDDLTYRPTPATLTGATLESTSSDVVRCLALNQKLQGIPKGEKKPSLIRQIKDQSQTQI